MNILLKSILAVTLLFFSICPLYSQSGNDISPITPQADYKHNEFGIVLMLGGGYQTGDSYVLCEDCIFTGATGFGYSIGLTYQHQITKNFFISTQVIYDNQELEDSYVEITQSPLELENGQIENVNISNRHTSNITSSSIISNVFGEYMFNELFFVRLGGFLQFPQSTNFLHEMELLTRTVTLSNGIQGELSYADDEGISEGGGEFKRTIDDEEYPDVNSPIFGIHLGAGVELSISDNILISPFFMYNIPMSNFSEYGDNFRVQLWRFGLEITWEFHETK